MWRIFRCKCVDLFVLKYFRSFIFVLSGWALGGCVVGWSGLVVFWVGLGWVGWRVGLGGCLGQVGLGGGLGGGSGWVVGQVGGLGGRSVRLVGGLVGFGD